MNYFFLSFEKGFLNLDKNPKAGENSVCGQAAQVGFCYFSKQNGSEKYE